MKAITLTLGITFVIAYAVALPSGITSCEHPQWKGDNHCDDGNNNQGCGWDGGDCCGNDSEKKYCAVCDCLDPNAEGDPANASLSRDAVALPSGKSSCEHPQWKGDNHCDDGNNNKGCGWDGGDCCGNDAEKKYCAVCDCLDPNAEGAPVNTSLSREFDLDAEDAIADSRSSECYNYYTLYGSYRETSYSSYKGCDIWTSSSKRSDWKGSAWYRFSGNRVLPEYPPIKNRCGTNAPGWLTVSHPQHTGQKISSAKVCFHWSDSYCRWHTYISIRNCGSYFVYYLPDTPGCSMTYCSSSASLITTTTTTPTTTTPTPSVQVRLGGSSNANEGYVEVNVNNQGWKGVCDDGFGINDARVICRMLGYSSGASDYFTNSSPFGYGSSGDYFAVDDLNCSGNEESIADCVHDPWYTDDCSNSEWAGVRCIGSSSTPPSSGAQGLCPSNWINANDLGCYYFTPSSSTMSYASASAFCNNLDNRAHLVEITNSAIQSFVRSQLTASSDKWWIGANDIDNVI